MGVDIAAFFLSFFLFIPLSIMSTDPATRLAMGPTESTQGRVVSTGSASACRGGTSHRLAYAFSSKAGGEYRGAATVCEESPYYSATEGDAIPVRFLKSDPIVNALASDGRNQAPPIALFLLMPLFFLAIFGSLFWPSVRDILRARRLFKSGRLASGKVVFVKKGTTPLWPGMTGNMAAEVFIEYQVSGGEKREAVATCRNDWLLNQLTPGTSVHIAYSDDKPAS